MQKIFLSLLIFLFSILHSQAATFKNYSELYDCVETYNTFFGYKKNLKSCFQKKGITIEDDSIKLIKKDRDIIQNIIELDLPQESTIKKPKRKLSDILNDIFKPDLEKIEKKESIFNKPSALSDTYKEANFSLNNKDFKDLSNYIKSNPESIYSVTEDINILTYNKNYLSELKRQEVLLDIYNSFDPIVLSSKVSPSTQTTAFSGAGGMVGAAALAVAAGGGGGGSSTPSKLSFSLSASSSLENAGTTITLTATTLDDVTSNTTINLSFSGTATRGTDYSISQTYITIPSGSKTASQTFTITDDSIYEGDETITFTSGLISGDATYVGESASIGFTISENESAPTVTLTSSASSVAENGSALTLTATLSGAADEAVTVGISTSGTGTEGTDYATISDITISAGSTTGTTSFTPTDDSSYEGSETGIVAIDTVSGGGATENGTQSVTITITDDESAPTVTLTSSASSIAENAGSSLTLTATLSGATNANVTVSLSTSGTGTEGTDYGTVSDITITAGSTTGTATFTPTDDSVYEGNETGIIAIDTVTGGSATENGNQSVTLTITENESAPTVTLTSSASSIAENAGSSLTLTATLSVATTANVTVALSTSGTGTEGSGGDYATVSDITITAGSTTGTTSFTPTDDSTFEGDETAIIDIDSVSGGSASENGTQRVTITINEDDSGPAFSISNVTTSNENAANATFTVTMSTTSSATATVDYATSNGTATASSDYTSSSGTLTFSPGDTSKTFTVPVLADSIYEGNETVTITLSNAVNATISTSTATLTITDDESAPTVTLTSSASSVAENGSALTLTATLSVATTANVTVGISTSGTGTEGTDYGTVSDITITAGQTTGTTSFTPTDDTTYEGNETGIIAIDTVSGGSATENGTQSVTITITENENAPTVTLTSSASSIAENAGSSLTLTATLSVATTANVTVGISTSGTGTEGTDYGTVSDITITAGSTTGTATFTPTDDTTYEGNETGIIAIDTVSGGSATENGTQSVTLTITENENAPTVTLTSSASSIAENAGSSLTLTATLSVATTANVTVGISTSGTGTEGSGGDYATISNITITAGQTTGTTSFTPTDDSTFEGNETAIIDIDSVSGGSASENGTQRVTITINEDDSGPALSINDVTTSNENTASATFTVTMSTTSSSTVTVDYATSNGTATASSDYTASSGTLTFSAGDTSKTFTVPVLADSVYEGNETVTITLSNASNASISDNTGILTITDDESAPTVTLTTSATSVAENGSDLTLTATLSGATDEAVTVALSTSGTGTEGTDYASLSDITITAGQTTGTTSFNPSTDSSAESSETAVIAIDTVTGGGATEDGTQTVTITITNSGPSVTLSTSATTVNEKAADLTLTATLSAATSANVTVALSTSGTGTEGTDYASLSDITITAGQTTGTTSFNPTSDTLYETSETAIIDISSVSGGGASEDGTQRVTISITDKALDSGTQNTYNSSTETAWLSDTEFTNSGFGDTYGGSSGGEDPYKNINLHKALAYTNGSGSMRGSGQVIAVMDLGFQVNGLGSNNKTHIEFSGTTITTNNNSHFTTYSDSGNNHGTMVASVAAGNHGTGATMGVAPEASLHLHDFAYDYQPTHWAAGTLDAENDGAVVQNNSWGFDQQYGAADLNVVMAHQSNNSLTGAATLVHYQGVDTNGDGTFDVGSGTSQKTWTEANWNSYVSALNSFQDTGVVVFALSNDDSKGDADISAGLPELFTSLQEAWLNVANIDIEGTSSKSYTLKSAPCGSTAKYCLGADGWGITGAGGTTYDVNIGGVNYDYQTTAGSSFAAPQVSGGIAILASHFPNHSPEQLADRLLASAYNDWSGFGVDGNVTFGNGVVHGYSTDYGHGVMDLYAALQPITTSMLGRSLYTAPSNTSNLSNAQSLDKTSLRSSRSFGDAIINALEGKTNYFYDAMGSQFKYNVSDHVSLPSSNTVPTIVLENEMNKLTSANFLNKKLNLVDQDFKNIIHQKNISDNDQLKSVFAMTLGTSAIPTQSFFNYDQYMFNGITDYNLPFLNRDDKGLSLNSVIEMEKLKFSISTTTPMKENDNTYLGNQKSILNSLEYDFSDSLTIGLLNGFVNERENFLGLDGNEALSTKDLSNLSKFNSIKLQKNILDDFSVTLTGSYANSSFDGNSNSMIGSANNIESNSFSLNLNKANLFRNDNFAFSISQPNRVYSGNLKFRFSERTDKNGTVKITEVPVELNPSGRQIDTTLSYTYDFSDNLTATSILTYTNELNHIKDNKDVISSFVGLKQNNLKLGLSQTNSLEDVNFMVDFKKSF